MIPETFMNPENLLWWKTSLKDEIWLNMIIIGIGGFLKAEESCIAVPFLLPSKGSDTWTSRVVYDEFPCHQLMLAKIPGIKFQLY